MATRQDRPAPSVLTKESAASFSSVSSTGSATSAASARSGGSKLLFGEIDTSSDRSSKSYASVCSFVLCDSGTFLRFWLDDTCRNTFLSFLPRGDLARLRRACHDFSARAAPALFADLRITFKASTFTKPARLAALDRLGVHVKTLAFHVPHTRDTFLPPLVDPDTGEELSFTYTPQIQGPSLRRPKYGDIGTTEILTRQYPALFHAATNVPAFVRAFAAFPHLQHLQISCPGYDPSKRYRRSIVDFALISLRIAVEHNGFHALNTLTLAPIHPGGLLYLSPLIGYGATPRSVGRWSRIQNLTIHANSLSPGKAGDEPDHYKLLQTFLRNFQANLHTFDFRWSGDKGPFPIQQPVMSASLTGEHPAHRKAGASSPCRRGRRGSTPGRFPQIQRFEIENVACAASDISAFTARHKRSLQECNLEDVALTSGTWEDALAPLTRPTTRRLSDKETADIPIILSPSAAAPWPMPMERVEAHGNSHRRSMHLSRWLSGRRSRPTSGRKVREGILGCEEQLKKVLGGVLSWK